MRFDLGRKGGGGSLFYDVSLDVRPSLHASGCGDRPSLVFIFVFVGRLLTVITTVAFVVIVPRRWAFRWFLC